MNITGAQGDKQQVMTTRHSNQEEQGTPIRLYTIGSGGRSAESFFLTLRRAGIRRLIDIRLHNTSHLAGFTKQQDLRFFLKEICQATYVHEPRLAPTEDLLSGYHKKTITWAELESRFRSLLESREIDAFLDPQSFRVTPSVLLCSEPKPDKCHRGLVAEYLKRMWGEVLIIHL